MARILLFARYHSYTMCVSTIEIVTLHEVCVTHTINMGQYGI